MYVSDDELLEVDGVVAESGTAPLPAAATAPDVIHRRALPVGAQVAVVAATAVAAGAVTAVMIRATRSRRTVRPVKARPADRGLQIIATRSFLVDVHVLASRDAENVFAKGHGPSRSGATSQTRS